MGAICFGNLGLGLIVGLIFSLLFVSFDKSWKKIISTIFAFGTSGIGLWAIYDKYGITDYVNAFTAIGIFSFSFLIAFIVFMIIMCKIMRDKDDKDVLRIRDIILGQKRYIEKYYQKREKEIDEKLNIPALEQREKNVSLRELKWKDSVWENCMLQGSEWQFTPMKGLDLTSCEISGIAVDLGNLRGLQVTSLQALELCSLLGLVIQ